ncbi:MAG: HAMP domain-containing sensor histidine kinase [Thermaerobacter sp.]|nr:HAMP domain-containing sensor histidine kinase [Thermaerobacter sp.]
MIGRRWRDRLFGPLAARLVWSHVLVAVLGLGVALGVSRIAFERYLVSTELTTLEVRGQQIARVMHGYFAGSLYGSTAAYLVRVLQGTLADRVYVVDNTGQVLLTAGSSFVPPAPFPTTVLHQVLVSGVLYKGTLKDRSGHEVAAAGVPVTEGNNVAGGVFLEAPVSASSQRANSLTVLLLAGEGVAVVLAGILAYAFGRQLAKPLEALRRSVGEMGEGDSSARAPVGGPQEVAAVAREFNRMADRLEAQMAQLAREAESREALMAHVAHDLRTPLTSIRGFLEAVRDGLVQGPRRNRAIDVAWEETLRLQRLVERLLVAARIRSGGGEHRPVEVADWVKAAVERMEPIAARRGQHLIWRQQETGSVWGIEDHLLEALLNVLDNALKWSPDGADVFIDSQVNAEDGMMAVAVSDGGPGIHPDVLPHIFDRFVTGDPARREATGLGLTIVDDVLRQHAGRVQAENLPEGGARITLWLPLLNHVDANRS